ncbi:sensor histidine kinase [Natronomonas sp. EA1]|uniref:sensor histidine kinase n=1 Tax=Natronomonas sp. EA1 TaxID=3421655 RepID=UPI003EC0C8E1
MSDESVSLSGQSGTIRVLAVNASHATPPLAADDRFVLTTGAQVGSATPLADVDCLVLGGDGGATIAELAATHPSLPVVAVPENGSEAAAVAAFRAGAADYVSPEETATLPDRVVAAVETSPMDHERVLHELHRTANRLTVADSPAEVAAIALEAATDILDHTFTGIWTYDEAADALVPLDATEGSNRLVGTIPRFDRGTGLAWQVFEAGEPRVIDDVHDEPDRLNPDSPIKSEIIVPLGEYGVIMTGTTDRRAFSTTEVELFSVLAAATAAALLRADREAELERQNERLDAFTRVVSHDLRSPLSVILGNVELAKETGDLDQLDVVERAANRMNTRIDELLSLAREGNGGAPTEPVSLAEIVRQAWDVIDTADATLEIETDRTVEAVPDRLAQLFENLFRNAVEHGSTGSRSLTVTVGDLEDGFYVEDTGPGVPESVRDTVFEEGVTTGTGTGLGLAIVRRVASDHGWEVSLGDGPGARFEFRTA